MSFKGERVKSIIQDHLGLGGKHSQPIEETDSLVDDLGADSLDAVELTLHLEEEFKIEIPDEETQGWSLVSDVIRSVESRLEQGEEECPQPKN